MTEKYLQTRFSDIRTFADAIENRGNDEDYTLKTALTDNAEALSMCRKHGCNYYLIEEGYSIEHIADSINVPRRTF